MSQPLRQIFTCVAAVVLMAPAFANKVERLSISGIESLEEAPVIRVLSDQGERWNRVDPGYQTLVKVNAGLECQTPGRDNRAYDGEMTVPGFLPVGDSRPLDSQLPTSLTVSRVFTWGDGAGQSLDPVAACNSFMDQQVASGQAPTKYHVLANGLSLTAANQLKVNYALTCNRTTLDKTVQEVTTANVTAKIVCGGSDDAARRVGPLISTGSLMRVDEVRLDQSPNSYYGDCPMNIAVGGTIKASAAGVVTYQMVGDDGWQSEPMQLQFDRAGQQKTVELNRAVAASYNGWMQINVLSPAPAFAVRAPFTVNCR